MSRSLEGAVGPLGDDASDWRLGLAWRNASAVLGDALALRLWQDFRSRLGSKGCFQRSRGKAWWLHAAQGERRGLALCLTGQLRGRDSVADLTWVAAPAFEPSWLRGEALRQLPALCGGAHGGLPCGTRAAGWRRGAVCGQPLHERGGAPLVAQRAKGRPRHLPRAPLRRWVG